KGNIRQVGAGFCSEDELVPVQQGDPGSQIVLHPPDCRCRLSAVQQEGIEVKLDGVNREQAEWSGGRVLAAYPYATCFFCSVLKLRRERNQFFWLRRFAWITTCSSAGGRRHVLKAPSSCFQDWIGRRPEQGRR